MYVCAYNYVYTFVHTYVYICNCIYVLVLFCMYVAPLIPPIIVNDSEMCTTDSTVSWTSTSGLSYDVTLLSQSGVIISDSTMDISYNFTGFTPNTEYDISIVSVLNSCIGTLDTR